MLKISWNNIFEVLVVNFVSSQNDWLIEASIRKVIRWTHEDLLVNLSKPFFVNSCLGNNDGQMHN